MPLERAVYIWEKTKKGGGKRGKRGNRATRGRGEGKFCKHDFLGGDLKMGTLKTLYRRSMGTPGRVGGPGATVKKQKSECTRGAKMSRNETTNGLTPNKSN